jgi:hypothetical protein
VAAFGGPVSRTRVSIFYQIGLVLVTASLTELSYYDRTNYVRVYIDRKRKSVPFALPHVRTTKMHANASLNEARC